jgi:hypothetical protein
MAGDAVDGDHEVATRLLIYNLARIPNTGCEAVQRSFTGRANHTI